MHRSVFLWLVLAALSFGTAAAYSEVPRIKTHDWTFEGLGGCFGIQEYEIPWLPRDTPPRFETDIRLGSLRYSLPARASLVVGSAIGSLLLVSVLLVAFIRHRRIDAKTAT